MNFAASCLASSFNLVASQMDFSSSVRTLEVGQKLALLPVLIF